MSTMPFEPVRLASVVCQLKACSRRDAEQYIAGGWVRVNGVIIEQPSYRLTSPQAVAQVSIDDAASLRPLAPVTILLNKPAGYDFGLTQAWYARHRPSHGPHTPDATLQDLLQHDAMQCITRESQCPHDRSAIRPLQSHFRKLIATSPLESAASGLVVYTQDRSIARKLMDDASRLEQEFSVQVTGTLSEQDLKRLNQGFYYQAQWLPAAKVSWQSEQHLRFALKNVQLHQVETMCQAVGLQVVAMRRLRIGRLSMARLATGTWRYLMPYERF